MTRVELESALSTLDIWLIVFGLFVAIGVVGESVVGSLHWRKGNDLQAAQTTENLALQNDLKQAELQLEQIRFPRRLNIDLFHKEMESFPKEITFEVLYDSSTADAAILANSIFVGLLQAGWHRSQKLPAPLAPREGPAELRDIYSSLPLTQQSGGGAWGLSVVTNAEPDLDRETPAAKLVSVLGKSVIGPPSMTSYGRDATMPNGLIRIIVGPKLP
jgi:hypothetical protein